MNFPTFALIGTPVPAGEDGFAREWSDSTDDYIEIFVSSGDDERVDARGDGSQTPERAP